MTRCCSANCHQLPTRLPMSLDIWISLQSEGKNTVNCKISCVICSKYMCISIRFFFFLVLPCCWERWRLFVCLNVCTGVCALKWSTVLHWGDAMWNPWHYKSREVLTFPQQCCPFSNRSTIACNYHLCLVWPPYSTIFFISLLSSVYSFFLVYFPCHSLLYHQSARMPSSLKISDSLNRIFSE